MILGKAVILPVRTKQKSLSLTPLAPVMALEDAWNELRKQEEDFCPDCGGSGYAVDGQHCECGIAPKIARPPITPTDETSAAAKQRQISHVGQLAQENPELARLLARWAKESGRGKNGQ